MIDEGNREGLEIVMLPVQHEGNRSASDEEVAAIGDLVAQLLRASCLGGQWKTGH